MTLAPPADIRRIVYMGTPELAVPSLLSLHSAGYEIPLVVSRPDARRSRGGARQPSPVKAAALGMGLAVTERVNDVVDVGADLAVVVAYGRVIPTTVLERLAMVNTHFSLLPRWRGAAPVERAMLAGDSHTGVCLMAVEPELDSGGIYRRVKIEISAADTAESLRVRLVELGSRQLIEALAEGLGAPRDQVGEPVYAEKIRQADLEIDWSSRSAEIDRLVRVGGAWTRWRGGRFKINSVSVVDGVGGGESKVGTDPGSLEGLVVATGDGALELVEVQPEGRSPMPAEAWINGARPLVGERLGG